MPIVTIQAITAQSMADAFGVSVSTVRRAIRDLKIKPKRTISGLRLFSRASAVRVRSRVKGGSRQRT